MLLEEWDDDMLPPEGKRWKFEIDGTLYSIKQEKNISVSEIDSEVKIIVIADGYQNNLSNQSAVVKSDVTLAGIHQADDAEGMNGDQADEDMKQTFKTSETNDDNDDNENLSGTTIDEEKQEILYSERQECAERVIGAHDKTVSLSKRYQSWLNNQNVATTLPKESLQAWKNRTAEQIQKHEELPTLSIGVLGQTGRYVFFFFFLKKKTLVCKPSHIFSSLFISL